jgi:hypothetical protein
VRRTKNNARRIEARLDAEYHELLYVSPTLHLHQRRLSRRVSNLQPVSEGSVLWTSELGGATGIKDPYDAGPRGMQLLTWRAP